MFTRNLFIAIAVLSLAGLTWITKLTMSYLFLGYGLHPEIGIPVIFFLTCTFALGVQEAIAAHYNLPVDCDYYGWLQAERDAPDVIYRGDIC